MDVSLSVGLELLNQFVQSRLAGLQDARPARGAAINALSSRRFGRMKIWVLTNGGNQLEEE